MSGTKSSSVIILPETAGDFLCLAFTGVVTREDHLNGLVNPMKGLIQKYGQYCLLIHFRPDYKGYAPDAADQSFIAIREMGPFARRIGYVNPTERKLFQTQIMRGKLGQEVRNFDNEDLAAAIRWARDGIEA